MIKALQTRLTLLILGGTIFSILLVSIIVNISIFQRFDDYMEHGESSRIQAVVEILHQYYEVYGEWDDSAFDIIRYSHDLHSYDIVIKDEDDQIIFTSNADEFMEEMHHHMMRNMNQNMGKIHESRKYTVTEHEIIVNDNRVGTIEVGSLMPYLVTEREVLFSRGVNSSILFAAIISIIISILLGVYASKYFSKPIMDITKTANAIREGQLGVTIDITDKTKEFQELSQSINHLSKSLRDQKELRKRLTSDISHELRTPLTVLQSHIEAISDGVWQPTEEKLNICKNEVIHLIKLVEQLKHLTDIENHKLELEIKEYNLTQLIREVGEGFGYNLEKKQVTLNFNLEENIILQGDKDKIRQVLINLLSNASKFTNSGDGVEVLLADGKKEVLITIRDTGIGIPETDLPNIFERFYRSDQSRSRKTGGAGIGLTIVASILEAHQGKISVTSEEKEGTEFKIILPKNLSKPLH